MSRELEGVRELREEEISQELADTTTTTTGVSSVQSEEWLDRIVEEARPMRRFEAPARVFDDLVGSGDKTLHIPKSTKKVDITVTGTAEGADRTYTSLDNLDTVDVSITPSDFYKGGVAISKEAMMTTNVNMVAEARRQVTEALAQDVDVALRDEMVSSAGTNIDQTSSSRLTPDSISDAMRAIESNDYVPYWLIISPAMQHDLRTDSQFTDASEYGDRSVVAEGEIGTYLGLRVVTSTNVGSKAVMAGRSRSGEDVGAALVWKERPSVGRQFDPEEAETRIFYDQAFNTATIQAGSIATIQI